MRFAAVVAEDAPEAFVSSHGPNGGPGEGEGNDVADALVVALVMVEGVP